MGAVYYVRFRLYALVLRVGESHWNARYQKHLLEGCCEVASGDSDLVFGYHFPFLWAYKLRRWGVVGELYSVYYPGVGSYADLQKGLCSTGEFQTL